jgi:hypothetical protein
MLLLLSLKKSWFKMLKRDVAERLENDSVCKHDDAPCYRGRRCFVRVSDVRLPFYVCVRVRFKGSNSVVDRGLGMTVYEKLKRAGLISDE